jgi:hypothetical protein
MTTLTIERYEVSTENEPIKTEPLIHTVRVLSAKCYTLETIAKILCTTVSEIVVLKDISKIDVIFDY